MPRVSTYPNASLPLTGSESAYLVQAGNSRKVALSEIFGPKRQSGIALSGLTVGEQTGIPSWVNRITVIGLNVSTGGTNNLTLQVSDSGTYPAGYLGTTSQIAGAVASSNSFSSAVGLTVSGVTAAMAMRFRCTITRFDAAGWVLDGMASFSNTALTTHFCYQIGGLGPLDRLRVQASGDTFDAGVIGVSWE